MIKENIFVLFDVLPQNNAEYVHKSGITDFKIDSWIHKILFKVYLIADKTPYFTYSVIPKSM